MRTRVVRLQAIVVALALMLVGAGASAFAQDVPSVVVNPVGTDVDDPHDGTWFVFEVEPGGAEVGRAAITNPADVAQEVRLDIRDLVFDRGDRFPYVRQGPDEDIGQWANFSASTITIEPGDVQVVEFSINIPSDAEPGDHIGAVVATTTNVQKGARISREIATRLYVTVPGDARRSMLVDEIEVNYDFLLWPTQADVTVHLRNDGNVRLRPQVTIRGAQAEGATILLSRSTEQYSAAFDVPWYGSILRLPVVANAEGGLTRTATTTRIVFPLGLFIILVIAGSAIYAGRRWWKKRKSATAELKQDIQRLEQLITQQAKSQGSTAAVGAGPPAAGDVPDDEEAIILAALKRARRSNDDTALARIALAKHMTSGDALDLILEALGVHSGKHREALLGAAVSYGADALSTHERFRQLPAEVQTELGERLVTVDTPSGNGHGNGRSAKVPQPVVGQTDSDRLRAELAKVKGVGPAKQEALVARFGSLEAVREAKVEDLTDVSGIGYATAREILEQLKG